MYEMDYSYIKMCRYMDTIRSRFSLLFLILFSISSCLHAQWHIKDTFNEYRKKFENLTFEQKAKLKKYALIAGGTVVTLTAVIIGYRASTNQAIPNPNCVPACEYVAIPDWSAYDAPVIIPGPNLSRMDFFKEEDEDDLDNLLL